MAGGISQTLRVGIINSLLRNTAWPAAFPVTNVTVTLHTASPGSDGSSGSNEVSGSSYAAQQVAVTTLFSSAGTSADPSVISNTSAVTFPTATTPGYTATHFALWNHISNRTAANFIMGAALTASQAVAIGNTPSFAVGAITHTFTG